MQNFLQIMCHAIVYTPGMRDILRNLDLNARAGVHNQPAGANSSAAFDLSKVFLLQLCSID